MGVLRLLKHAVIDEGQASTIVTLYSPWSRRYFFHPALRVLFCHMTRAKPYLSLTVGLLCIATLFVYSIRIAQSPPWLLLSTIAIACAPLELVSLLIARPAHLPVLPVTATGAPMAGHKTPSPHGALCRQTAANVKNTDHETQACGIHSLHQSTV